jgi:hypothetical protein
VVNAMKNRLMLFIASYQSKMSFFPPDNGFNVNYLPGTSNYEYYTGLNPLLYELTGAPATNNATMFSFVAFDGAVIPNTTLTALYGRGGIANSNPDETRPFYQPLPGSNDYAVVVINGLSLKQLVVPVPLTGAANEVNLWHYDSSSANRHNSSTYDLWAEYSAGKDKAGKFIYITNGNW